MIYQFEWADEPTREATVRLESHREARELARELGADYAFDVTRHEPPDWPLPVVVYPEDHVEYE